MLCTQLLSEFRSPDCTLTTTMFFSRGLSRALFNLALRRRVFPRLIVAPRAPQLQAQQPAPYRAGAAIRWPIASIGAAPRRPPAP